MPPTVSEGQIIICPTFDKVWRSPNLSVTNEDKIYHSNVLSVLLYGAECWRVTQRDSQRLSGFPHFLPEEDM